MAGNLDILRLFDPGTDVCDALGQFAIQHGFVHQIHRIAPYAKLDTLIYNRAIQIPTHTTASGNAASGFAVGAKNAVGIAARDGLNLNMIGSGGDGGPVFGLAAVFFHAPSRFNVLEFLQHIGITVLFSAIL